jgi:hypothetical protein
VDEYEVAQSVGHGLDGRGSNPGRGQIFLFFIFISFPVILRNVIYLPMAPKSRPQTNYAYLLSVFPELL